MLFLLSHPIQYYSPFLRALSKEINIDVIYLSDCSVVGRLDKDFGVIVKWDIDLLEGYNFKFIKSLFGGVSLNNRFFDVFNPGIIKEIFFSKHKIIVVNGWAYSSHLLAIVTAKLLGREVWMRGDNPINQIQGGRWSLKRNLKKIILSLFFFLFIDRFLYVGNQNKQFYQYFKVARKKLTFVPHTVDNVGFKKQYLILKQNNANFKELLNITHDNKVVLFSGKLIEKKRPFDLLNVALQLRSEKIHFIFVGDGELMQQMESFIQINSLTNVTMPGFVNQSDISSFYSIADVFVMCSGYGETWGLVVNEAMNFSLPIICTNICGCCSDLVIHNLNGYVFDFGDTNTLKNLILKVLSNDQLLNLMGCKSAELIEEYSNSKAVANILSQIKK